MRFLIDIAPIPSDYVPMTPAEIAGDMFSRALPAIVIVAVIVVVAAFIISKINKK